MSKVKSDNIPNDYVLAKVQRAIDQNNIRSKRCFVCGGDPTTGSGEHVVPMWLQKKLGLFDKRIRLINGTFIPYRSMTVPCCSDCNTGFLSRIENEVKDIVERGSVDCLSRSLRW